MKGEGEVGGACGGLAACLALAVHFCKKSVHVTEREEAKEKQEPSVSNKERIVKVCFQNALEIR